MLRSFSSDLRIRVVSAIYGVIQSRKKPIRNIFLNETPEGQKAALGVAKNIRATTPPRF